MTALILAVLCAAQGNSALVDFGVTEHGEPVPCRIHLAGAAGKPFKPPGLPFWKDHFVCPGTARIDLPVGSYTYEVERGPEYGSESGRFEVVAGRNRPVAVELHRLATLSAEGWWSGELHVHRPLADIELLMKAEDLHVAPVITWWNNRNPWEAAPPPQRLIRFDEDRFYQVLAGEDEREGGALLFLNLDHPLAITKSTREYPSPMRFVADARKSAGVHVDIEKPFWWDVPVWAASGQVDTIGLANNHMCRSSMGESEAWGRPRDAVRLPPPRGNGYWTQEIYYHLLNGGLRLPPSAGSASGVLPNPVGYNRSYVHLDGDPTYEKWFEGLRAGRSFVTNGPLLRAQANRQWPGHVFSSAGGADVEVSARLDGRDPVEAIEIIRDGKIVKSVPMADFLKSESLGALHFSESGWFLVRAISSNEKTFRFASTAPWYVEIAGVKSRIHRASARFFLDWIDERMPRIKIEDPEKREEVLEPQRRAREFWEKALKAAVTD